MQAFGESFSVWNGPWRLLVPLGLAALTLYFLLPRPRGRSIAAGAVCGILGLFLGGLVLFRVDGSFSAEAFLFYAFSGLAIVGGVSLVTQRNPARAAIAFALVVMNVCGLFLLQAAPFLMAAAIIIYAGAIIVTFLFVLMLAQQTGFSDADDRTREPFTASCSAFVMLGALLLLLDYTFPDPEPLNELIAKVAAARERGTTAEIRTALGDPKELIRNLRVEETRHRGSANVSSLQATVDDLAERLSSERATAASLQTDLMRVVEAGRGVTRASQRGLMPAENVAALGRLLYSDHMLAVELGGTLLLVATIGAIAITARRAEVTQ